MIIKLNLGRTSEFHTKTCICKYVHVLGGGGGGVRSILKGFIIIMSEDKKAKMNTMHALESSAFRFILFFYISSI